VIGKGIENSIQASLALGLTFNELTMLPSLIERERKADPLILKSRYSTPKGQPNIRHQRPGHGQSGPRQLLAAARRAGNANWSVIDDDNSAVGIAIKNNFGLIVGYLALNYSRTTIDRDAHAVGKDCAGRAAYLRRRLGPAALVLNLAMRGLEPR